MPVEGDRLVVLRLLEVVVGELEVRLRRPRPVLRDVSRTTWHRHRTLRGLTLAGGLQSAHRDRRARSMRRMPAQSKGRAASAGGLRDLVSTSLLATVDVVRQARMPQSALREDHADPLDGVGAVALRSRPRRRRSRSNRAGTREVSQRLGVAVLHAEERPADLVERLRPEDCRYSIAGSNCARAAAGMLRRRTPLRPGCAAVGVGPD
jgi:hypothetical protein